jgi:uncharacterized protein (DUF302 family)
MYAFATELDLSIEQAIERLKAALASHKMGIVSEVDVQAIMKAKMNHEIGPYRILGICGPGYARRVIEADADMGALLPCGCAVYESAPGKTRIAMQNPNTVAAVTDKPQALEAMSEARAALEQVIANLATAG